MVALALGAAAFGAVAVGVLAIGRLAVSRMAIKKARFDVLEVDELTVRRLRVLDYDGPPPGVSAGARPYRSLEHTETILQHCPTIRRARWRICILLSTAAA
jgi:hypothetical protein